jgi:hypothetical protein
MTESDNANLPDVNQLIVKRLQEYSDDVTELAIQAIRLAEMYPVPTVVGMLGSVVKTLAARQAGEE